LVSVERLHDGRREGFGSVLGTVIHVVRLVTAQGGGSPTLGGVPGEVEVVNDDRARQVAERLAELSRQRERGLMTEWEYHEASRLLLEGTDEAFPGPGADHFLTSDRAHVARVDRRERLRCIRLAALVVILSAAAAAIWFLLLRSGDAVGTESAPSTSIAEQGIEGTSVPVESLPDEAQPTTTTTIAAELLEVGDTVMAHRRTASELRADAEAANALWEERTATYADTHEEFLRIASEARVLAEEAAGFSAPTGFVREYRLTVAVLEELADAAEGLVAGLEASDDGTRRRESLEALIIADRAHDAAVTALLTQLGIQEVPEPAL
jgi:hypothetical protein